MTDSKSMYHLFMRMNWTTAAPTASAPSAGLKGGLPNPALEAGGIGAEPVLERVPFAEVSLGQYQNPPGRAWQLGAGGTRGSKT